MQKLLILGDSYADPTINSHEYSAWYELLENHFEVSNYAYRGTGPEYSLKILKENEEHFNAVVFVYSHPLRLNFDFLKDPSHATTVKWIIEQQGSAILYKWKRKKWDVNTKESDRSYILDFYDEIITRDRKSSFLSEVENELKRYEKSIIIPVYEKINDFCLNDVSKMEFGGSNVIDDLKFRKNHMCEENHYILYQYIVDTLRGKENKPNFIKNVFNSDYIYE